MNKTITKLNTDQKNMLVSDFMKALGKRMEIKRKRINLSQKELADCLEIDRTTLSRYENGSRDMPVSVLPLISTYCRFPLSELFPVEESRAILDMFAAAVTVKVERKCRQETDLMIESGASGKKLKGQIYEIEGKEVFEPVRHGKRRPKSLRSRYRDAEVPATAEPCTDEEFCAFVKSHSTETVDAVLKAGEFLEQIKKSSSRVSLKNAVADYIIDELVLSGLSESYPDRDTQRIYAYYKALYQYFKDGK